MKFAVILLLLFLSACKDEAQPIPHLLKITSSNAKEITQLQRFTHNGTGVNDFSWSPDGKYIATVNFKDGFLRIWETNTGVEHRTIQVAGVKIEWSPNGKLLAVSGSDELWVFEADTSTQVFGFSNPNHYISTFAWSPDSRFLAIGGYEVTSIISTTDSGDQLVATSELPVSVWEPGKNSLVMELDAIEATALAWNQTGDRLAVADISKSVGIWDVKNQKLQSQFATLGYVNDLIWLSANTLLTADTERIQFWDIESGELTARLFGHYGDVNSISISPIDRRIIASGSDDDSIILWNITLEKQVVRLKPANENLKPDKEISYTDPNNVPKVSWSPDGTMLAASNSKAVYIWGIIAPQ